MIEGIKHLLFCARLKSLATRQIATMENRMDDDVQYFHSWDEVPDELNTRNNWEWLHDRRVLPDEEPTGVMVYARTRKRRVFDGTEDAEVGDRWETFVERAEAKLYRIDQTRKFKPTRRTRAVKRFWRYFVECSSSDYFIWECDDEWISCLGKLSVDRLKTHLTQGEIYGVRAHHKLTRFGGIDADLHEGDPDVFLDQLRALQDEFHGRNGWHYHLRDQDVGGVHLIQVFEQRYVDDYLGELRAALVALDAKHPGLVSRAHDAGMKSFSEMEIFPSSGRGFRLPFARGRSLYLNKLLPLLTRGRKKVADVVRYLQWIDNPIYPDKEVVFRYVAERLRQGSRTDLNASSTIPRSNTPTIAPSARTSDLGRMKGRYAKVITEFWSGNNCPPDSLNKAIQLLALVTPYYFTSPTEAVQRIEQMVNELPDHSFSDRLLAGKRSKVHKVIRKDVASAFSGYSDQPRPEETKRSLDATFSSWRLKGFNPFDKASWAITQESLAFRLGPDFEWSPDDTAHLEDMAMILKVDFVTCAKAIKHLVRIVEGHAGELSIEAVKRVLEEHQIRCRSKRHNKASKLMAHLRSIDWIYLAGRERWEAGNPGGGKARAYGIGKGLAGKFSSLSTPILSTYYYAPLPEETDSEFDALDLDELRIEQRRLQLRQKPR